MSSSVLRLDSIVPNIKYACTELCLHCKTSNIKQALYLSKSSLHCISPSMPILSCVFTV